MPNDDELAEKATSVCLNEISPCPKVVVLGLPPRSVSLYSFRKYGITGDEIELGRLARS